MPQTPSNKAKASERAAKDAKKRDVAKALPSLATLAELEGADEQVKRDLAGKPILLSMWATEKLTREQQIRKRKG